MSLELPALAKTAQARLPSLLFLTVSGSHLYGFPSEDSDIDLRGCHRLPLEDLVGLRSPTETCEAKLEQAGREVELVSHDVGKYLRLLLKHNGYVLEQIFSPLVVLGEKFLALLRPLAQRAVTRSCYYHYRGFVQTQRKMLEREPVKKAKTLLYAYRVLLTGTHLLQTGEVEANLPVLGRRFDLPFLDELIQRKLARELGQLPDLDWEWHRAELDRWEARLDAAFIASSLPEHAPFDELDQLVRNVRFGRLGL